jgi:hypothetical protein
MSRIEKNNNKFMVAFGADPTTGSYVQVWHQPSEAQDGAFIRIDNQGVALDDEQPVSIEAIIGRSAWTYLMGIKKRYELAFHYGHPRPNIDAETASIFLTKLGFVGLGREIHAAFD